MGSSSCGCSAYGFGWSLLLIFYSSCRLVLICFRQRSVQRSSDNLNQNLAVATASFFSYLTAMAFTLAGSSTLLSSLALGKLLRSEVFLYILSMMSAPQPINLRLRFINFFLFFLVICSRCISLACSRYCLPISFASTCLGLSLLYSFSVGIYLSSLFFRYSLRTAMGFLWATSTFCFSQCSLTSASSRHFSACSSFHCSQDSFFWMALISLALLASFLMRRYSALSRRSLASFRQNYSSIFLTTCCSISLSYCIRWLLRLLISSNFRYMSLLLLSVSCSTDDNLMLLLLSASILWASFLCRSYTERYRLTIDCILYLRADRECCQQMSLLLEMLDRSLSDISCLDYLSLLSEEIRAGVVCEWASIQVA